MTEEKCLDKKIQVSYNCNALFEKIQKLAFFEFKKKSISGRKMKRIRMSEERRRMLVERQRTEREGRKRKAFASRTIFLLFIFGMKIEYSDNSSIFVFLIMGIIEKSRIKRICCPYLTFVLNELKIKKLKDWWNPRPFFEASTSRKC